MAVEGVGGGVATLRERLEALERVTRETGHYGGLKELKCRAEDPIKYEICLSRLLSAAISSREAAIGVAASPLVVEGRENVFVLYTPEGDAIVFSEGIMTHIDTIGTFIRSMIRADYEHDPGIHEGDLFANNESWYGCVHTPDLQMVAPLFYQGKLIGWVGTVFHEIDVGTVDGGNVSLLSPERFGEGVHFCMEKVGVGDQFLRSYHDRVRWNTRAPDLWILDDKARLAGLSFLRERVREVIEEFGLDYYQAATREVIEEKRREFLVAVKERLVPGRYRSSLLMYFPFEQGDGLHPLIKRNWLHLVPVETRILSDGRLVFDYEGASKWGFHPYNSLPVGMEGVCFTALLQCVGYEGAVNYGVALCMEHRCPKGSITNVDYPYASTAYSWATSIGAGAHILIHIGISHFARGFLEEVFLTGPNAAAEGGGEDQYGKTGGWINAELAAQGSGARAVLDGLDAGYQMWNPESDQGNVEIWEMFAPVIYLGRNFVPNHHGYGRFRGSAGWESLFMLWRTRRHNIENLVTYPQIPYTKGLFGGYPSPPWFGLLLYDTNVAERIQQKKALPRSTDEALAMLKKGHLKGRAQVTDTMVLSEVMKTYDLFSCVHHGGPGYGDPLDRDFSSILQDLNHGILDEQGARRIYGAIASFDDQAKAWRIDEERSGQERRRRKEERLSRGIPVRDWWVKERGRVREGALSEPVRRMFQESFDLSSPYRAQMQEFWQLPEIPLQETEPQEGD